MECRELSCVPEDVLGSLWLQQLQDGVGSQAPELHLHGSHRQQVTPQSTSQQWGMTREGPKSEGEPLSCPPSSWIQGGPSAQGSPRERRTWGGVGVTWGREESRAEVGVHAGQEGIEDAPPASPVGSLWLCTHLQGILFLPAAPMEEEEEEEGDSEQNREGAFQGASHGPCWLRPGERGRVRAQPGESHRPLDGTGGQHLGTPLGLTPCPEHTQVCEQPWGIRGHLCSVPFG